MSSSTAALTASSFNRTNLRGICFLLHSIAAASAAWSTSVPSPRSFRTDAVSMACARLKTTNEAVNRILQVSFFLFLEEGKNYEHLLSLYLVRVTIGYFEVASQICDRRCQRKADFGSFKFSGLVRPHGDSYLCGEARLFWGVKNNGTK